MDQQRRCQYKFHEDYEVEYLCVYPQCQSSKLFCSECFADDIHRHDQPNNHHIMTKRKFMEKLGGMNSQMNAHLLQNYETILQAIQEQIKLFQSFIQLKVCQDQNLLKFKLQAYSINNCFNILTDDVIKYVIEGVRMDFTKPISKINQLAEELLNVSKNITLPKLYGQHILQQAGYNIIIACQISHDYKFIASGSKDQVLNIWDYQDQQLIRSIPSGQNINVIRFSDDSKQLFLGQSQGYLTQYDLKDNINQVYQEKIHQQGILNIILANQHIYTSSVDGTIIKMNINTKEQIFLIKASEKRIDGLCFDFLNNKIIACSEDKSIKVWDQNGEQIIQQAKAHENSINQVQVFKQNLLSLDHYNTIKLWQINYKSKQLKELKQYQDKDGLFNISIVQDQYILAVSKAFVKIYDVNSLCLVKQYQHDVQELCIQFFYISYVQNQLIKRSQGNSCQRKKQLLFHSQIALEYFNRLRKKKRLHQESIHDQQNIFFKIISYKHNIRK